VHLFGEPVPGWRLENPLPICVEVDTDGRSVASDDIFNVYGVGESWDEAVSDYKVALVEFFEITESGQDDRSLALLQHLGAYLKRG
jgi:predicted RNase H-like HicB family nuclease